MVFVSTGQPDDRRLGVTGLLAAGRFDALLAVLLAVLAVSLGSFREAGWVIALDVVAAALAALVARWPTVAGVGLGLLLLGYLFVPDDAPTLGEYAPLIAILGAGMRGQRRLRAWMCAGFGVVLALLTYRDYPGSPLFLFGTLVWVVLFAVLWLIGDLFTAHRRMQLMQRHSPSSMNGWLWPESCTTRPLGHWHACSSSGIASPAAAKVIPP